MRASVIVGVFVLTAAIAGTTEWASRRAARAPGPAVATDQQAAAPSGPTTASNATADAVSRADAPEAAGGVDAPVATATHTLVLGEGHGGFRLNAVTLSDEAVDAIDAFLADLDCDMTGVRFVIEGHTDNLGSEDVNRQIGLARALAVRQYLAEQYEIPVGRMRVLSLGADQPVADNATQEGRSMNRRVVIKVIDE